MKVGVCAAAVLGGLAIVTWVSPPARAVDDLTVTPAAVAPGGTAVVTGSCPDPVAGPYVRATVGIDSIDRYVVVQVSDGSFSARVPVQAAGSAADPTPGSALRMRVSCATQSSYVASVGNRTLQVVTAADAASRVVGASPSASAEVVTRTSATVAASHPAKARAHSSVPGGSTQVPLRVPLVAFGIAIVGTIAAVVLSRRSEQRAAAMAGHPAQRGVGREPRRARK